MNITICSASELEKLAMKPFQKDTVLISIDNVDTTAPPYLFYQPSAALYLRFDDMIPQEEALMEYPAVLFNEDMAKKVAEFVYLHKDANELICQCACGISRSAGIAAAVMEHFYKNGAAIFEDGWYRPNVFVYQLTLEALSHFH